MTCPPIAASVCSPKQSDTHRRFQSQSLIRFGRASWNAKNPPLVALPLTMAFAGANGLLWNTTSRTSVNMTQ